jgi:hypothetical protein
MSLQLEQILQAIVRVASAELKLLLLVEQTKILRQLEQRIDPAHSNEPPASSPVSTTLFFFLRDFC